MREVKTPPYGIIQEPLDASIHISGIPKVQMESGVINNITSTQIVRIPLGFAPIGIEIFGLAPSTMRSVWSHGVATQRNSSVAFQQETNDNLMSCACQEGYVMWLNARGSHADATVYAWDSASFSLNISSVVNMSLSFQWRAWGV